MSGMKHRTDRIEARVAPAEARRIRYASELIHTSVSNFMVTSTLDAAEDVITRHSFTLVSSEYFDQMLAALDSQSEPMPRLEEAAQRHRLRPRFERA